MIDEITINKIISKNPNLSRIYIGTFARDELPLKPPYPSCFIFNTKNRSHEGEHWLSIYIDNHGICEFYDSYGNHPSYFGLEEYINKISNFWTWNSKKFQYNSSFCGIFCIAFLFFKSLGKIKEFYKNYKNEEYFVYVFLKKFYLNNFKDINI